MDILLGHSHLSASHQSLAEHNGALEIPQVIVVGVAGAFLVEFGVDLLEEIVAIVGLEMFENSLGEHDVAQQVFIAHDNVTVSLEGDAHVMALLYEPLHGASHRHHDVVGVGAEDEHTLGVGLFTLGTIGVVGIGLAARPTCDGVLQIVENLDVDVVSRIIERYQLAQAIVIVILIGEFQDRFSRLFTQPHDGPPDKVVIPLTGGHFPGVADAREARGGIQVGKYLDIVVHLQK